MRIEFTGAGWAINPVDTMGMDFGKTYCICGVVIWIVVMRLFALAI